MKKILVFRTQDRAKYRMDEFIRNNKGDIEKVKLSYPFVVEMKNDDIYGYYSMDIPTPNVENFRAIRVGEADFTDIYNRIDEIKKEIYATERRLTLRKENR